MQMVVCVLALFVLSFSGAYKQPHYEGKRTTMVHLFEWPWPSIATECEQFLGPKGFGGVQISPPNENRIVNGRPWWERYQPLSYLLHTRSGTEQQLIDMITRCNRAGVRIYVDAVLNHMTGGGSDAQTGTGGSLAHYEKHQYPAVPYGPGDFNGACNIIDYQAPQQVRNCRLLSLLDLNQSKPHVRQVLVNYMNRLIDMGVAGFRIDAAKHMWPQDLEAIYGQLHNLNTSHGFAPNSRPFIFQEVIDLGSERITTSEYSPLGCVTEFRAANELGKLFRGRNALKWLHNWGPDWSMLPSGDAVVFVDNHDNQRGHGAGAGDVLTHKDGKPYETALVFLLAHPYGLTRVMSSYAFNNSDQGPPATSDGAIVAPRFLRNGQCDHLVGWICEHRWPLMARLIELRNIAGSSPLTHWWSQHDQQIAFARANAFVAINMEKEKELNAKLQTGLPSGVYCDIIDGEKSDSGCSGRKLYVDAEGWLQLQLPPGSISSVATHINAKL
ncbi:alpha-amylase-like [Scaptodrosophila lebanonensis]|uniref:Alpha-amylase n=1 Tax=Drosophila lebanonensis TaxID=7225 RepID=A0A6J2TU63_DROLE|nr:alpha-amylase-like [Scaptodrosophila lebanonensis]